MTGRRPALTDAVSDALVEAIAAGAFDWVAAEAAGIGRRTFYDWISRGERGQQPFATLLARIRIARAKVRLDAERLVLERDPLSWLRLGPGRERDDEPGWTAPVRSPVVSPDQGPDKRTLTEVINSVKPPGTQAEPAECPAEGDQTS